MWNLLRTRLHQPQATVDLPVAPGSLPERFRGLPAVRPERCPRDCRACAESCPTQAVAASPLRLDLGRCVFCDECVRACPGGAIEFTRDYRLAARTREALELDGRGLEPAGALDPKVRSLFGRSLRLRQVSAGGCNGCEAELVALGNVIFDLGRYGIQFVASPRHADGIVVTGPVSRHMEAALRETFEAVPGPRLVIAVGACAISGGIFRESSEQLGGVPGAGAEWSAGRGDGAPGGLPVDLYVPGCPPHPLSILDGLLRLVGRL
jgi:Ni,Fe-hydrogenase III small subunit